MNAQDNVESDEDDQNVCDEEGWTSIEGINIPPPQKPTLSFDPTGPRLMIMKVTNNFFKSYAGNQILGPFHKCYNAVVGPNGSGKSNVIDSLLFVFGYRATRIRCKKVSVLLHNSEYYQNVLSCTVAVHFALIVDKDGDNYEVVPGSEFTVSRTAHKDNSSYYELNGRRVQFKDVAVILKKHGIDLDHNRFLILQGEVEQISMMKCKADKEGESGMLEYLEDVIGTTRFKKPLEQVHERVEILTERRTEKLNRMKLVETELDELRGPMEEAVGFIETENKVVQCKNILYQKSILSLKEKIEDEEKGHEDILAVQKDFIDKLEALSAEKSEKEKIQQEETKAYSALKKRNEHLNAEYDKANKKDVHLRENMLNMNDRRKKTKELIQTEKKKLLKLESVPEDNEKSINEMEVQREKTQTEKEKLESEKAILLRSIEKETKGLQNQKEVMEKDLAVLKEAVNKTKSAFDIADTELKLYVSNEQTAKTKLEEYKKQYEACRAGLDERGKEVATLKKKIPSTEKDLKRATEELRTINNEEAKLIMDLRMKKASLEEGRSSMQASRSSGRVLDALMKAKREGKCPGLFGRLGDLGAIDQKYDVAISTACGPLDNIVVDTVDCAQWCIEFLKKYDIGRAVFIALDKQEHLRNRANIRINTPENVHRLYDLISVNDERVKTAFYYALRDTLVANNLDQASRIAYGAQRYRVVTLGGDLIETTGTMSGGGKKVMKGRMGQSVAVSNVDPQELENLDRQIQQMEVRLREMRERQTNLDAQANALDPELWQMRSNLEKANRELQTFQQQQPILAKLIETQTAAVKAKKADQGQVKKLTAIVEAKRETYEQASEAAGELQVEVDRLTAEIKAKSVGKINVVDKSINECTKRIEKLQAEMRKMKVAIKTAERNCVNTKDNIARMEQDVEDMENKLRQMKNEREQLEVDGKELLTQVENTTAELTEKEKKYAEIKKEVDQLQKQENQLKSEKIDVDQKVKVLQKKLNELEGGIRGWEAKLKQLKLQEIPNQEVEELPTFTPEELNQKNEETVDKELKAAESHLKAAKPNLSAIQQYYKKQLVYIERGKELEEITNKRGEMRDLYDKLRTQRKNEFIEGYNIIKLKLKEMYQMITLGGDAELEMVDTYDPFTEGIQFNVRPPRKTWKKIANLSGGEKTLSSLSLVFALHYYKPSPLYVLDEIDAALDFKNVSIVANYIKEKAKNAQFIIISLRSNMFELCDNLIGIYKTYNCTKSVTLNPKIYSEPTVPQTPENQNIEVGNNQAETCRSSTDVATSEAPSLEQLNNEASNLPEERSEATQTGVATPENGIESVSVSASDSTGSLATTGSHIDDNAESEKQSDGVVVSDNAVGSVSASASNSTGSLMTTGSHIDDNASVSEMEISCSGSIPETPPEAMDVDETGPA